MQYLRVDEARDLPGLRLVLTAHVPGPWGESAKRIFDYKKLPYAPVAQMAGQENPELIAWTGSRNAPVAVYDSELPRTGWYDILMLGERLAPNRPLLPERSDERALVVGLSMELCGEWGFGWARRTMMMSRAPGAPPPEPGSPGRIGSPRFKAEDGVRMGRAYGSSLGDGAAAARRCADIVGSLAVRLHDQRRRGSSYLVGDAITACDIYWATFSSMLKPLPHDLNPMPDWMRSVYAAIGPEIEAASDPILIEHRDFIYEQNFELPLDF